MAKKLKGIREKTDPLEGIPESAQQIWEAGMAAFKQAQKQGGKLLEALLQEGEKIQSRTRRVADETFTGVQQSSTETRHKLEEIFEDRVAQAMARLGVPTNKQLAEISARVDALEKDVRGLRAGAPAAADEAQAEKPPETAPAGGGMPVAEPLSNGAEHDDLKRIRGIGPALERKLNAHGITSYGQISGLDADAIRELETSVINSSGRVARENWVAQARDLHSEKLAKNPTS